PTHMDHHMGVPTERRDLFEIYVRLGKEYGIPPQIFRFEGPDNAFLREQGVDASYFDRLEAEGYPIIDHRVRPGAVGKTLDELRAAYYECFRRAQPGVSMIKLHLGMYDEELIGIMGAQRATARFNDYQIITDEATSQAAERAGVKIISWRPIKEAFDAAMSPRSFRP
ncbi:MAG: ChbG/HpnK family deacetylase, partial [Candidatus Sumerlaeota bacterium]|nr:ChbG/HpnK family deacetylase [Candidatus Sumerlaeota bacterium]